MPTSAEIREKLEQKKKMLADIEAAIVQVAATGQSYSINTGQTQHTRQRANLSELTKLRDQLNAEIEQLEAALSGGGATRMVPAW